jgi:hypothetical protein
MKFLFSVVDDGIHHCDNCGRRIKKLLYCIDANSKLVKYGIECVKNNVERATHAIRCHKESVNTTINDFILSEYENGYTHAIASEILSGGKFKHGKYTGKCIRRVAEEDISYLIWFYENFQNSCPAILASYRKRIGNILARKVKDFKPLYDFTWPPPT